MPAGYQERSAPTVKPTSLSSQPWEEVAVDLMGPLPSGEHLLVLVDYYTRWMEVDVIRSTSSKTIIHCLDAQFARHGLSRRLRTDNGSNLVPKEVEEYLKEIHLIPKWRKIHLSFAFMLISPYCLVLSQWFFWILQIRSRQRGPINMKTKE